MSQTRLFSFTPSSPPVLARSSCTQMNSIKYKITFAVVKYSIKNNNNNKNNFYRKTIKIRQSRMGERQREKRNVYIKLISHVHSCLCKCFPTEVLVCVFVCRCLCVCVCGLIRKPFVVVLYDRQRVFAATLLKGLTMANMQLKIKPRNRSPLPHFLSNYCRGVCVRMLLGCTDEIHSQKAYNFICSLLGMQNIKWQC